MRHVFCPVALIASVCAFASANDSPVADLSYGPASHQLFDWYPALSMPNLPSGPRPWVLFVHGSGSTKVGIGHKGPGEMLDLLRHNGITVFSANWANYPAVFPAMRDDLVLAVQYLKSNAATFGIDKDRMVLWGVSAGAVIAGWLTYGPDFQKLGASGAKSQSTRPVAFMNWGGLTNFLLMDPTASGLSFGAPTLAEVSPALLQSLSVSLMVDQVPRSVTPPVQSYYGKVSDPPPYKNPHDIGLMKDLHQHLQAYPSAWSASTQESNPSHPHIVFKQLEPLCEWTRGVLGVGGTPLNLGGEVAGKVQFPKLYGSGTFEAGGVGSLSFHAGRKEVTPLFVITGAKRVSMDAGGVELLADPAIVLVMLTDTHGELHTTFPLGPSLPVGMTQYMQFFHADSAAKTGVAASNAIRVVTQ